jgi:hypothetical protein
MKVAIMQPYFFPYLGYFQLVYAVDTFVIYDDVQYIKGGWINRNRILLDGRPHYLTLPIKKDSTYSNINQRELAAGAEEDMRGMLRLIEQAYRRAPFFGEVSCLLSRCFGCSERNLARFVVNCLEECFGYLGIGTRVLLSSQLAKNAEVRGEDRVIDVGRRVGATSYVNAIGGVEIYDRARFAASNIELWFLRTRDIQYRQFGRHPFVPSLSIIDVMMFNSKQEIAGLLDAYDLV